VQLPAKPYHPDDVIVPQWMDVTGWMPVAAPSALPGADQRAPVAGFRAAMITVCALLSVVPPRHPSALVVLLVLLAGAWAAYRTPRFSRVWPYLGAVLAAGAACRTGGARSPLLPYLLAPGLSLGLVGTQREVILGAGAAAGAFLVGGALTGELSSAGYTTAGAQWVLLSVAVGLVALWARRLAAPASAAGSFVEVRQLLRQLRSATRRLPGGLDAPAAAEVLLDRCHEVIDSARSAVLVQPSEGSLIPLAVRGARRVPWRTPLDEAGPLRDAWMRGQPVVDVRAGDAGGRRRGSAVAAIPFQSDGKPFGLVVLESFDVHAFSPTVLEALQGTAEDAAIQLETALLFEEVRSAATMEERGRLARDMHDGVAQELAFLGYQLDDLRSRALKGDADLAERTSGVRRDLTRLISDIRLSITDLRSTISPERGLAAVLGSYLRAVCAGKDIVLHVSLQDSAFRLAAEQEVLLFSAVQLFTQPLRRTADVRNLWVELRVDPPSASLRLEHDGPAEQLPLEELCTTVGRLGGTLVTATGSTGGPRLQLTLGGSAEEDPLARVSHKPLSVNPAAGLDFPA